MINTLLNTLINFNLITFCDAPFSGQLGTQAPGTSAFIGMISFHYYLLIACLFIVIILYKFNINLTIKINYSNFKNLNLINFYIFMLIIFFLVLEVSQFEFANSLVECKRFYTAPEVYDINGEKYTLEQVRQMERREVNEEHTLSTFLPVLFLKLFNISLVSYFTSIVWSLSSKMYFLLIDNVLIFHPKEKATMSFIDECFIGLLGILTTFAMIFFFIKPICLGFANLTDCDTLMLMEQRIYFFFYVYLTMQLWVNLREDIFLIFEKYCFNSFFMGGFFIMAFFTIFNFINFSNWLLFQVKLSLIVLLFVVLISFFTLITISRCLTALILNQCTQVEKKTLNIDSEFFVLYNLYKAEKKLKDIELNFSLAFISFSYKGKDCIIF